MLVWVAVISAVLYIHILVFSSYCRNDDRHISHWYDILAMGLESTVGVAKVGTNSVRTTVPEGITEFLEVKAGDKLEWKMDIRDNERAAIVTKKSDTTVELVRHWMVISNGGR